MSDLVKEKRKLFEVQLQSRSNAEEACNIKKQDAKRKVRENQKRADERNGEKLSRRCKKN